MKQAEDELTAAAERIREGIAKARRTGYQYVLMSTEGAQLFRELLEGEAARWAPRPVGDLATYLMSPACKLARHILGRTT